MQLLHLLLLEGWFGQSKSGACGAMHELLGMSCTGF